LWLRTQNSKALIYLGGESALEQYKILKELDTEMANELLKVINE
jgi:hypothetical protein|tara:strand:+ start:785 stop:916 length:132 start_codon:yes stop_codon:yes gene_type:complete